MSLQVLTYNLKRVLNILGCRNDEGDEDGSELRPLGAFFALAMFD